MSDRPIEPEAAEAPEQDEEALHALRTMPRLAFIVFYYHARRKFDVPRIARRVGISERQVVRNLIRAVKHGQRVIDGRRSWWQR